MTSHIEILHGNMVGHSMSIPNNFSGDVFVSWKKASFVKTNKCRKTRFKWNVKWNENKTYRKDRMHHFRWDFLLGRDEPGVWICVVPNTQCDLAVVQELWLLLLAKIYCFIKRKAKITSRFTYLHNLHPRLTYITQVVILSLLLLLSTW